MRGTGHFSFIKSIRFGLVVQFQQTLRWLQSKNGEICIFIYIIYEKYITLVQKNSLARQDAADFILKKQYAELAGQALIRLECKVKSAKEVL